MLIPHLPQGLCTYFSLYLMCLLLYLQNFYLSVNAQLSCYLESLSCPLCAFWQRLAPSLLCLPTVLASLSHSAYELLW